MKTVLLLGNSVWFDALAASLPSTPEMRVIQAIPATARTFIAPAPIDLVVMDESQAVDMLALLRIHPTAIILTVDVATGNLTALQGHSWVVRSIQEVAQAVLDMTSASLSPLTQLLALLQVLAPRTQV